MVNFLASELKILMETSHPNIVRVFDVTQDEKNFYIVQEVMKGGDLRELVEKQKMTEREAARAIK
jgi:serine/threonine protein kinase